MDSDKVASMTKDELEDQGKEHGSLRNDSIKKNVLFDLEAYGSNSQSYHKAVDWRTIMKLAFQCIGVVYGDLGTSPLYVLPGIFPSGIKDNEDILGALSLIFYCIFILTFVKYVCVVLSANDHGDGGTFALYSLICRHAKVNLIPNHQKEDKEVFNYRVDETIGRRSKRSLAVKTKLEQSYTIKYVLLFMTMLGVSMLIGDGVLTPVISVLSAVSGIKEAASSLTDTTIMWISVVILVLLFQIQRFGTDKVGYLFAPILVLWFLFIGCIGVYNFVKYDPGVIKALNPWYIIHYFKRNGKDAWISLGGVILCLTGSEALFADLGHFNIRSIQISSCLVLIPSIYCAYFGQCAYLRKHPDEVADAFYKSIPKPLYWPQFILAVLASIIASQSLISASFSIVQQSVAMGCFPRVKVVHTSLEYEGQVYVPEINTILMIACVGVTLGFKNTLKIGNAYGIAVAFVFVITSGYLILIMVLIWKTHLIFILMYMCTICVIELVLLSSVLYKFVDGGYLPLIVAFVIISIMLTWNYGYRVKYLYEVDNKISVEDLRVLTSNKKIQRLEGIGLFYAQLVNGISPIVGHYISSIPALHSVMVFVAIKHLPIGRVPPSERFLFQRVKLNQNLSFLCVVRYGYKESKRHQESFEDLLVHQLKEYVSNERAEQPQKEKEELALIVNSVQEGGVVYLLGESEVRACEGSSYFKRFIVDCLYNWLTRCVRQPDEVFVIPRTRLLKVGMTYQV